MVLTSVVGKIYIKSVKVILHTSILSFVHLSLFCETIPKIIKKGIVKIGQGTR